LLASNHLCRRLASRAASKAAKKFLSRKVSQHAFDVLLRHHRLNAGVLLVQYAFRSVGIDCAHAQRRPGDNVASFDIEGSEDVLGAAVRVTHQMLAPGGLFVVMLPKAQLSPLALRARSERDALAARLSL
jgi:hypothetical protein